MSIFIDLIFAVPAALRATAIQIAKMAGQGILACFSAKIFLQLFDARVKNFLNPAVLEYCRTNKVIVMVIWVRHFITGYIVPQTGFSEATPASQKQSFSVR